MPSAAKTPKSIHCRNRVEGERQEADHRRRPQPSWRHAQIVDRGAARFERIETVRAMSRGRPRSSARRSRQPTVKSTGWSMTDTDRACAEQANAPLVHTMPIAAARGSPPPGRGGGSKRTTARSAPRRATARRAAAPACTSCAITISPSGWPLSARAARRGPRAQLVLDPLEHRSEIARWHVELDREHARASRGSGPSRTADTPRATCTALREFVHATSARRRCTRVEGRQHDFVRSEGTYASLERPRLGVSTP
jgi:hypothetical protein